jgi:hypothetical protein
LSDAQASATRARCRRPTWRRSRAPPHPLGERGRHHDRSRTARRMGRSRPIPRDFALDIAQWLVWALRRKPRQARLPADRSLPEPAVRDVADGVRCHPLPPGQLRHVDQPERPSRHTSRMRKGVPFRGNPIAGPGNDLRRGRLGWNSVRLSRRQRKCRLPTPWTDRFAGPVGMGEATRPRPSTLPLLCARTAHCPPGGRSARPGGGTWT